MNKFEASILSEEISKAYATDEVKRVFTPFSLVEDMLRDVDLRGNILVLSDLGFLPVLAERGVDFDHVTFIAHTQEQFDLATEYEVANVLLVGYNTPIKEMERQLVGMKFDVVVGNPPYGNLHLPILKKAVEHLADDGISITIQPVRWLQDPLWRLKKSTDAKRMEPIIGNKIESLKLVSRAEASAIFNARFNMDLAIFKIRNDGGNFCYDEPSFTVRGIDIRPFKSVLGSEFKTDVYQGTEQHFVPLTTIYGGDDGTNPTKFVAPHLHQHYGYFINGKSNQSVYGDGLTLEESHKVNKYRSSGKTIGAVIKKFETADEAKNFFGYITTDAFRFFMYITTIDVHINCRFLPFPKEPNAFTVPWSNARFYEYFDIKPEQQKVIENTMNKFKLK